MKNKTIATIIVAMMVMIWACLPVWADELDDPQEENWGSLQEYPEEDSEDPMEYSVWWTLTVHQTKEGYVVVDAVRRHFAVEYGESEVPTWDPTNPDSDIIIVDDDF